jgi:hypothetical protein
MGHHKCQAELKIKVDNSNFMWYLDFIKISRSYLLICQHIKLIENSSHHPRYCHHHSLNARPAALSALLSVHHSQDRIVPFFSRLHIKPII